MPATSIRPLTCTPRYAAGLLCMHYDTLHELVRQGVFTVIAPVGRGPGKRIHLHTDEIEKFGETRDVDAVMSFRRIKGRLKRR